jgi:hypothetical protein
MRRILIVFLFLFLPFSFPTVSLAQPNNATQQQDSLWTQFWNWITGIFIKNDYQIIKRETDIINSDMTKYGLADDESKHSSPGTRLSDLNNQICYKGNLIKNTILKKYKDFPLAYICPSGIGCSVTPLSPDPPNADTCDKVSIKKLAVYFVQTNQKFYCDETNKLIDTGQDVIDAVNEFVSESSLPEIPSTNFTCYDSVHKDFYLVPKENSDKKEENTRKILKIPISQNSQDPNADTDDIKDQLNKNFSPQGSSGGLKGLRPAGW